MKFYFLRLISCLFFAFAFIASVQAEEHLVVTSAPRLLPDRVSFNAHIRPLMSNTCFTCHGPDQVKNESGYRIDSFDSATSKLPSDESLVGIKPGNVDASEVYRRIMGNSQGEQMPPKDFRHQLTQYDKALFGKWIEQGAVYEQHWAYAPIVRPAVPVISKRANEVAGAIDAFVLSRLEEHGLEPSEQADKSTLLRRLSLDLIGLPPTIEELTVFLLDNSPEAYDRQVERLLSSKHFGERMASPWLDLVRFADTVGFHGDQNQHVFPYRDYVIDAFNDNKPFDVFTKEQIAGDLLPDPTPEQLTATGVLRLNMMTREGGAQPKEYLAKYKADRVRMLGTAWLGSTLGCCECHNHKYDPFTAKDFYSLGAFFDDLRQWGVYTTYDYTPNKDLPGFNNDYPFPPETRIESLSLRNEIEGLQRERDEKLLIELGAKTLESDEFKRWASSLVEQLRNHADGWIPLKINEALVSGSTKHQILDDDSLLLTGKNDAGETITIRSKFAAPMVVNSVRLEVLPDEHNRGLVGRANEGRFEVTLSAELETTKIADNESKSEIGSENLPLNVSWAEADRKSPRTYISGFEPRYLAQPWRSGPTRWQFPADETKHPHTAVYHFTKPVEIKPDQILVIRLESNDVGRVRLSATSVGHAIAGWPAVSDELREAIRIPSEQRSDLQSAVLVSAFHRSTVPFEKQQRTSIDYCDRILDLHSALSMTLIAQSIPADQLPISRVLPRGNWQDESGELAPPGTPHFLPQLERKSESRLTRLDLANWLTAESNPLTSRHFVNHTWKLFFGTGLSSKLDDLGNQGEWPSHPHLLDWLASEFVASGWDMKHIIRLMVRSRTYRQAAAVRSDLSEVDPYNRLLAQQSARRLDAEAIRDNALAISGLLRADYIGGTSVFPYQPDGHYANIQFPDRTYVSSQDYRQYRRGVYMHWQRSFLHPMLVNFDSPSRDECTADRPLSNSPQQALTLLNDPSFVEASHAMAARLLHEHRDADFDDLLTVAFLKALAREPQERELESLEQLFIKQLEHYKNNPTDAEQFVAIGNTHSIADTDIPTLAAWSQVCRVILNLHETITRF